MTTRYTVKDIAQFWDVTTQTVNRWIRDLVQSDETLTVESFGAIDSTDKRIRTFSELEYKKILNRVPQSIKDRANNKARNLVETVDAVIVDSEEHEAGALIRFGSLITPEVKMRSANVEVLAQESLDFRQVTASALNTILQVVTADLVSTVKTVIAQNKHAVSGIQATAATEAIKHL